MTDDTTGATGATAYSPVHVTHAGRERLDDVRPLWESLHQHHLDMDPDQERRALRDQRHTWENRLRVYDRAFAEQDGFLLIATDIGAPERSEPIGFALIYFEDGAPNWRTHGGRIAALETLSVSPERRGEGIGTQLMEAVFAELRAAGIEEIRMEVADANVGARRLYERLGMKAWNVTYLGPVP